MSGEVSVSASTNQVVPVVSDGQAAVGDAGPVETSAAAQSQVDLAPRPWSYLGIGETNGRRCYLWGRPSDGSYAQGPVDGKGGIEIRHGSKDTSVDVSLRNKWIAADPEEWVSLPQPVKLDGGPLTPQDIEVLKYNNDPSAQFLVALGEATSISDFNKRLVSAYLVDDVELQDWLVDDVEFQDWLVDDVDLQDWKDRQPDIRLPGADGKLMADEKFIDSLNAAFKRNPKLSNGLTAAFGQISYAIQHANEPECVGKNLPPGWVEKHYREQAKYDTDKKILSFYKVQIVKEILNGYFKKIGKLDEDGKVVVFGDATVYDMIAFYKNTVIFFNAAQKSGR